MVLHCRLSSERQQKRVNTKKRASGPPKTIKEKQGKLNIFNVSLL
jgi:hypothetical protein